MKISCLVKNILFVSLLLILLSIPRPAFTQNGTLDGTFGKSGKVITDFGGPDDYGTCIALQTDNKIVAGGYTILASKQYFALVRYNPNGQVDSSFGTNGKTITGVDGITELYMEAMKIQADGKIVTAGYLVDGANSNFIVIRYKTDGTPDSLFGINGIVIKVLTGSGNHCNAVDIDAAGGIVIAGNQGCKPIVIRLQPGGNTDLFFTQNFAASIVAFAAQGGCETINSLFLMSNNDILLGGQETGSVDNMFLIAFSPSGSIDSTFGTNGTVTKKIRDTSTVFSLTQQRDGKIVTAGFTSSSGKSSRLYAISRFNPGGAVDSSFGVNGTSEIPFSGTGTAHGVAMEKNDEMGVVGTVDIGSGSALNIVALMLEPDGKPDQDFNTNSEPAGNNELGDEAYAMAIQPDGKILVCGNTLSTGATGHNFIVMRFNETVTLPVKLASFTGAVNKTSVVLNWLTASELNNSYFNIERSNGVNFKSIGNVNSKGNTTQVLQYAFVDAAPRQGDNYYRLKQVDKDGKFTYSNIVKVVFGAAPYLKAYPNPADDALVISGLIAAANISVVDLTGKTVMQVKGAGNNYKLGIQSLAAGTYLLVIRQPNNITSVKFVKH